jgi:uncharacterized protein (TIGR02246 family)
MNDEDEIRELVSNWMIATKAGNSEAMLGLMTDDVVFLVAGQEPFGKSQFAKASGAQSKAPEKFDGESEILELKVQGNWAYMLTRLKITITRPGVGQNMVRAGHTLTILCKDSGKWQIARDANLLVPHNAPEDGA